MKTAIMLDLAQRLDKADAELDRILRDYLKRACRIVETRYDRDLGRDFKAAVILREQMVSVIWDVLDPQRVQEIGNYTIEAWKQVTGGVGGGRVTG